MKRLFFLICLGLAALYSRGSDRDTVSKIVRRDTLPQFTVQNVGNNRVIVGWINSYPITKQISIQRSFDSLKNYKTILTVTDPTAILNGFADTKAPNDHMFYRLFINLDQGQFFFTAPKKPQVELDTTTAVTVIEKIKDTMKAIGKPPILKKPDFVPSFYVYTNPDGYVFINLPDADKKKYHIKFYEEDDNFLFELKNIKESALTLDKANFIHSGWFKFELYNDDKLVEKNKFYLSKEF
jgi:hypothetical protein